MRWRLARRIQRWRRFRRLRKVPRRTYIISTTHERAMHTAKRLGINPQDRATVFVLSHRRIEGMRFLPGDRIVAESWPDRVHDVLHRSLIMTGVGVKSRNLYDYVVIR